VKTGCESEVRHDGDADPAAASAVRPSRVTKWRASVLIAIHVLIALHVVHWKVSGSTLSPLEPSESMEFTKRGVLNAGAVFFALAILSTAVFGRFFCGWGCHLVAIQDLCRWLLEKVGLKPRAVNLGVLGLVPWIVFVYMFLAPLAYRLLEGLDVSQVETKFSTNLFWDTFPGWVMATATIVATGGAMIYFLGAKGFCTYGCPYGAIFGIADQLSPMRIRVTDACNACGHCTVACTSNVRVHQEVRDWKSVVDPGCMKCLDCVSVCPKDALYVGFGVPALVTARATARPNSPGWLSRLPRIAVAAVFMWACLSLLLYRGEEQQLRLGFALQLAAGSLLVALVFAGKSERPGGTTLGEDVLLGAAFLAGLYAFRSYRLFPWVDAVVPLLLALGLAALVAFAVLTAARLLRRPSVRLQTVELLRDRRLTRGGWVFVAGACAMLALTAHAGWSQFDAQRARAAQHQAELQAREAFDRGVRAANSGQIEPAIREFEAALALAPEFLAARENLAGMYCASGRFEDGIREFGEALRRNPLDPDTHFLIGQAYVAIGQPSAAEQHWNEALKLKPDHAAAHDGLAALCAQRGDADGARRHDEAARKARESR